MKHGTTTAYRRGCRCNECRKAVASYARDRRFGVKRRVRTDGARAHIDRLRRGGLSYGAIAEASGVCELVVRHIHQGFQKTTAISKHEALMGLRLDTVVAGRRVPYRHVKRISDAILAGPLSGSEVAHVMRYKSARTPLFMCHESQYVLWPQYDKVRTLYRLMARRGLVDATLLEEVAS